MIAAEGEQRASRALREASEVIAGSPAALQLRYLQTLNSIAAEKNSTIVFPVPLELFRGHIHHDHPPPTRRRQSRERVSRADEKIDKDRANIRFEDLGKTLIPDPDKFHPEKILPPSEFGTSAGAGEDGHHQQHRLKNDMELMDPSNYH